MFLFVIKAYLATLDESGRNSTALHVKNITIADNDIRIFTGFDRSRTVIYAENFSGIQGNGLQCLLLGKPIGSSRSGIVRDVAVTGIIAVIVERK